MTSSPILTVFQQSKVSPPPATVVDSSLQLTYFDLIHLDIPPIHNLFFYELPLITKSNFIETVVPNLENSLSITFKHFPPFVGNLFVYPSSTKKIPEIRYVHGDYVNVMFVECNLDDFDDLTGYHPRNCDKFYHLIPPIENCVKLQDHVKFPLFSVQVTLFPNRGLSIGMTTHHVLCDGNSQFRFLNSWASIARFGTNESFLANETLPLYERLVKFPELDEDFLKRLRVDVVCNKQYQQPFLISGPSDKVRATFILTRTITDQLKKLILKQLPSLSYVTSFTVACAYIWSCIAKASNDQEQLFIIPIDCRSRLDPPIPDAYFGNCVLGCLSIAKTTLLKKNEGFINATKIIGENIHEMLSHKDGIVKYHMKMSEALFKSGRMLPKLLPVSGSNKFKLYDNLDFGFGKPKKLESITIDYLGAISVDACKDSNKNKDLEFGICLTASEMQAFVPIFETGLQSFSPREQIGL